MRGLLWSDTATITAPTNGSNSAGGVMAGFTTVATGVPCQVCAEKRLPTTGTQGGVMTSQTPEIIKFAFGTTVLAGNRITLASNGHVFEVIGVEDDRAEGVEVVTRVRKMS